MKAIKRAIILAEVLVALVALMTVWLCSHVTYYTFKVVQRLALDNIICVDRIRDWTTKRVTLLIYILALASLAMSASPVSANAPRHMMFTLKWRDASGVVHLVSDEIGYSIRDRACTSYGWRYPAPPVERPAPVVLVRNVWYVVIEEGADTVLYCDARIVDLEPAWIEDHDPGLPNDGSVLILDVAGVETVTIKAGRRRPVAIEASGYIPSMRPERLTVSLPVLSEFFELDDPRGPFIWYGVNVPDWIDAWHVTEWEEACSPGTMENCK